MVRRFGAAAVLALILLVANIVLVHYSYQLQSDLQQFRQDKTALESQLKGAKTEVIRLKVGSQPVTLFMLSSLLLMTGKAAR